MRFFSILNLGWVPRMFAASNEGFLRGQANPKPHQLIGDKVRFSDLNVSEVNVHLHEHITNDKVTSVDLKVSLPGKQEENMFFICSYMVPKKMPEVTMYHEDPKTKEWMLMGNTINESNPDNFVESEAGHWREVAFGVRMHCMGRIQVKDLADGSRISIFKNGRQDTADDITSLLLQVYDENWTASAQIFFSRGKFYITGGAHDKLFSAQGKKNIRMNTSDGLGLGANKRRRLDFYKFKCRSDKPHLNIKIGIVADNYFCESEADKGTAKCEDAAIAIVMIASAIFEKNLKVSIVMKTFMRVDWECDKSHDFTRALKTMEGKLLSFPEPKRAVYHFFTTCVPDCFHSLTGCSINLGLAYNGAISIPENQRQNVGVNRFVDGDTFTFIHEMGHSCGLGHFFSKNDRDTDDGNEKTAFGIMDYVSDQMIEDPEGRPEYNGIHQFYPKHDGQEVYGSKSHDEVCKELEAVEGLLKSNAKKYQEKFEEKADNENSDDNQKLKQRQQQQGTQKRKQRRQQQMRRRKQRKQRRQSTTKTPTTTTKTATTTTKTATTTTKTATTTTKTATTTTKTATTTTKTATTTTKTATTTTKTATTIKSENSDDNNEEGIQNSSPIKSESPASRMDPIITSASPITTSAFDDGVEQFTTPTAPNYNYTPSQPADDQYSFELHLSLPSGHNDQPYLEVSKPVHQGSAHENTTKYYIIP